jgi:hypothetical protein
MNSNKEHISKLKVIKVTQQEIWSAMRSNIQKNKKKYNRKEKHKGKLDI